MENEIKNKKRSGPLIITLDYKKFKKTKINK